jgi:hypothetical protein
VDTTHVKALPVEMKFLKIQNVSRTIATEIEFHGMLMTFIMERKKEE